MAVKRLNGEGSIRKKNIKGKTYWEGRYTDSDGKQKSVSAKTQSEVRDKLKKAFSKTEIEKNEKIAKDEGRIYYDKNMTLNQWCDIYMDKFTSHLKPQTVYFKKTIYNSIFSSLIGNLQIKYISEETLLDVIDGLKYKGLSLSTIHTYFQVLNSILNKALNKKIIESNPIKLLNLKKPSPKKPKRELTTSEIDVLLKITKEKKEYLYPLLAFLLHTGCRIGEAISLEWQDISQDMQFCTIKKTRVSYIEQQTNHFITVDSTPKNESSTRRIPLDNDTRKMLISLRQLRMEQNQYAKDKKIFLAKRFGILHETKVVTEIKSICDLIRETYDENFPIVTPHWFRHTFASRGIEKKVPMLYLQKIGGWSSMKMLSQIYGHMNDEQAIKSINIIYGE